MRGCNSVKLPGVFVDIQRGAFWTERGAIGCRSREAGNNQYPIGPNSAQVGLQALTSSWCPVCNGTRIAAVMSNGRNR
jgi:hypothetical protein